MTGAGAGTVASSPGGIACPSDCFEVYDVGTVVTLIATPGAGALFSGWSGSGCSGVGPCIVTMSAARTVSATFVQTFVLTVSTTGAGTVSSVPSGINCGLDCSEAYAEDTVVTLTAAPELLHVFVAWSGACSGVLVPICVVPMSSARSVSATFLQASFGGPRPKEGFVPRVSPRRGMSDPLANVGPLCMHASTP